MSEYATSMNANVLQATVLKIGSTESQDYWATGAGKYISYKSCPMKFYCKKHSLVNGYPIIWLLLNDEYVRYSILGKAERVDILPSFRQFLSLS